MTQEQKIIRAKVGLLELAKQLGKPIEIEQAAVALEQPAWVRCASHGGRS